MVISKTLLGIISLLMNCFRKEVLYWSPETVRIMYCSVISERSQDFGLEEKQN
jgi:hypothetical protein